MALAFGGAAVAGLVLWKTWWWAGYPLGTLRPGLDGHGPDPYAWPHLLALWVPGAHALFTLVYGLLGRWDPRGALRRHALADQWSLVLVVPLIAGLLLLGGQGPWRPMIGAWYTLFIGVKTGILVAGLWRWLSSERLPAARASVGIFLGAFLPYLFLGAHVTAAMSTTGDEPYYLLVTNSLVTDGDIDLADDFARRDYLRFYWGELFRAVPAVRTGADGRMTTPNYQGLQPILLVPGYAVAGRQGAMATMNLFGAAALTLVFRFALATGASLRAAFLAWLGAAFSAPFMIYAASPFPEMSGGFLAIAAAYLVWQEGVRGATLAIVLCLVALVGVKSRLFVLVPPLALGGVRRPNWTKLAAVVGAIGAGLALATVYDAVINGGFHTRLLQDRGLVGGIGWFLNWTARAPGEYRGHLGLLLDQEFGLLPAAPVFLLALAGIVVAVVERRWRLLLLTAGPFALTWYYLGAIAEGGVSARGVSYWYGGFSPPARFLMAPLPLLAVLSALALDRLRGRLAWTVTAALYAATLAYTVVLSIWPAWRFQDAAGRAMPLLALFRHVGLDPGRFLPSYVTPGQTWDWPGFAVLALSALGGFVLARGPGTTATARAVVAGVGAALLVMALLVGLAWMYPTGAYVALSGKGQGGTPFWGVLPVRNGSDTSPRERLVWATQRNGTLELSPRLHPGHYRIAVRAGAQGVDSGPTLVLYLGTDPPHRVSLESSAPPDWREQEYAFDVHWPGGRLPIRLELGDVSRQEPARLAYVDAVEIQRLSP